MKIIQIEPQPAELYPYWIVQTGGRDINGHRSLEQVQLPIHLAAATGLGQLDAIIATSDLQGNVRQGEKEYLLGELLPEFLADFLCLECPQLDLKKVGVLLLLASYGLGGQVANLDGRVVILVNEERLPLTTSFDQA